MSNVLPLGLYIDFRLYEIELEKSKCYDLGNKKNLSELGPAQLLYRKDHGGFRVSDRCELDDELARQ